MDSSGFNESSLVKSHAQRVKRQQEGQIRRRNGKRHRRRGGFRPEQNTTSDLGISGVEGRRPAHYLCWPQTSRPRRKSFHSLSHSSLHTFLSVPESPLLAGVESIWGDL